VRGEEGEHVVEEVVGEGADAFGPAARHERLLGVPPLQRHYVEQVACDVGLYEQTTEYNAKALSAGGI
jgi:hypothetical protein